MGDFDGEGLFILAAVVIAFVNWLSNSLKKKAAAREEQKRIARGEPPAAEEESGWPDAEQPTIAKSDANSQLHSFFESLAQTAAPAPPPPQEERARPARQIPAPRVEAVAPPPIRSEAASWQAPEVKRAKLSEAERRALANLGGISASRRKKRSREGAHPLIAKLRESGGAREAIVFAEIIGRPKALAEHDPLP